MDRQSMIDNEQTVESKSWLLPWLVLSVLGAGLLGLVLVVLYDAV